MKTLLKAAVILGGTLFLASAASAQANDASDESSPSWQGFYLGAHAAYHHGEKIDDGGCVGLCATDHKVKEMYLAVQGGFDVRAGGNLVIGAMAWAGVTPVKSEVQLAPGVIVRGKTDFAGFVGLRAGLDGGAMLPYAFVGYEYVTGTVTNDAAPIKKNKGKHGGIGAGVGLEYRLARHFSVDGRYMYSSLGKDRYDFGGGATRHGEQAHTFSLGANFRF